MMQSRRLAVRWIASSLTAKHVRLCARFSSSMNRTADPAIHAGVTEGIDAEEAEKVAQAEEEHAHSRVPENKSVFKNKQPFASSPKIESPAVNTPIEPNKQQRRHYTSSRIDGVSCVGLDGFPEGCEDDRERQEEADKEYFKSHKPSMLSEMEMADTRKPMTKATDGSAANKTVGGEGGVILFEGEQLESAEETMMGAMRIWRENAARGDPDAPHSRALRAALRSRGENVEW